MAALEILATALVGGALGLFLVILFDPQAQRITDVDSMISILAGALIAVGINRALRS